jgi:hypothetical protein
VRVGTGHDAAGPQSEPEIPQRPGTRKKWKLALVALIGTWGVLAVYGVAAVFFRSPHATSSAASSASSSAIPATQSQASAGSPSAAGTSPSAAGSKSASSATSGPAPHPLEVASLVAIGPQGASDGDNPSIADRVIDVASSQPWYSQWYATPEFGGLRSGVGLLLTLSRTATVRDVKLVLGSTPGADAQVRVGTSPSPGLPVVASASDASGTVLLKTTAAATGRYVLIWFTRLPPDGHGHYQVSVYSVEVDG